MTQTAFFGADSPIPAGSLPSVSTGLSWHNVQRQRLRKFAAQFQAVAAIPVVTLRSQGEPDVNDPAVVATREGFTQLRRDLPVIDQDFEYSGDAAALAKVKEVCLAWVRTNVPDGKPINETNLEWLLRVLARRYDDFSSAEQADIDAWAQALRTAKESAAAGNFSQQMAEGEGGTEHGNWWTHHYKVLLLVYHLQGDGAAFDALLAEIDDFAVRNFPYGNAAIIYPGAGEPFDPALHDMPRAAVHAGESIDYIRRDALHYQVYTLLPWVEIALLVWDRKGENRYGGLIEAGWTFFWEKLLSPSKHYEFAATSDPFDALRWEASHPEYLAPTAMFKPQRAAGLILAWMHWRRAIDAEHVEESKPVAVACRAVPEIASVLAQYFRWALGYGANA